MTTNKPTLNSSGRYKLQYRGTQCTNCEYLLDIEDKYCPNCSQANSTKKLTIKDFFDEFFSTLISYDSKLLKTLSALLLRPGKITRDYINGKRVSYTNPFRFLLSLSIIYFLMLNFTEDYSSKWDKYGTKDDKEALKFLDNLNFNVDNSENDKTELSTDSISKTIGLDKALKKKEKLDSLITADPSKYFKEKAYGDGLSKRFNIKWKFFSTLIVKSSIYNFEDAIDKYDIENSYENKMAFNLAHGILRFRQQPGSFVSNLISKLPFAIFFFLPLFALSISLAYIRKKHNYTDHLIFSFHNTSLLFILLIISFLIDSIFDINTSLIFFIIFCIYLFMAMRKFYKQGFFKTSVKYVFLNTVFFILATFSMIILSIGNIFTF